MLAHLHRGLKQLRNRRRARQTEPIAKKLRHARETRRPAELTRSEFLVMFDRITRRQLNMTADEFLARLDRGDLPDSPIVQELILMAGPAAR